jgi:tetratricopeptide (TPR) repeat protein
MDYAVAMIPRPIPYFVLAFFFAAPALAAPVHRVSPDAAAATLIAQAHDAQSRGNTELAVRLAQSAIVADPARPSAYDALGDVYAANNQPDAARSYYGEALSIDPSAAAAQKAMSALGRGPGQQAAKAADEGQKTGTCGPACVLTTPQ